MLRSRILLVLFVLGLCAVMYGCMKGEQTGDTADVQEDITVLDTDETDQDKEDAEEETDVEEDAEVEETEETVARDIYLLDDKGLVVPQTLELPKTKSAAT